MGRERRWARVLLVLATWGTASPFFTFNVFVVVSLQLLCMCRAVRPAIQQYDRMQLVLCAQECMRIAVLWPQAGRLEVGSGGTAPAPSQDLRPAKRAAR